MSDIVVHAAALKSVKGSLQFDYGLPGAGIKLRLYKVGFAGNDTLLQEAETDATGAYSITYEGLAGANANIQLRVLDLNNNEVTVSATKFGAAASETLNIVVPGNVAPLPSEYERLVADLRPIGGSPSLAQAEETTVRQDLTLLNETTGWDARLLALAATAASQTAATGLSHNVLYTLFRSGLPSAPTPLAMVTPDVVKTVLTNAAQSGIVNLNSDGIARATSAFQIFANKTLLAAKPAGAASSF